LARIRTVSFGWRSSGPTRTGARVVTLAPSVGSLEGAGDYLALFDYNVERLAAVLSEAP